jgi:hypothetical protein
MGDRRIHVNEGCSPQPLPAADTRQRRTNLTREVLARLLSQVVWSLSASAVVFLPGVFSADITEPGDFTDRSPIGR